jgi:hypothetical protein
VVPVRGSGTCGVWPIAGGCLGAAHMRPYGEGGEHEVSNRDQTAGGSGCIRDVCGRRGNGVPNPVASNRQTGLRLARRNPQNLL